MFSPASLVFYRYPAPGFRNWLSGVPNSVGGHGSCWSSAVSSMQSMNLDFYTTWFSSNSAHHRDYGFQLRCLSE